MLLDGMKLDIEGRALANDFESEDQSELAYYAAWMTMECKRMKEALQECMIEIDSYTDNEYPVGVHPVWDKQNVLYKKLNPARLALEANNEKSKT